MITLVLSLLALLGLFFLGLQFAKWDGDEAILSRKLMPLIVLGLLLVSGASLLWTNKTIGLIGGLVIVIVFVGYFSKQQWLYLLGIGILCAMLMYHQVILAAGPTLAAAAFFGGFTFAGSNGHLPKGRVTRYNARIDSMMQNIQRSAVHAPYIVAGIVLGLAYVAVVV